MVHSRGIGATMSYVCGSGTRHSRDSEGPTASFGPESKSMFRSSPCGMTMQRQVAWPMTQWLFFRTPRPAHTTGRQNTCMDGFNMDKSIFTVAAGRHSDTASARGWC